MGYQFQLTGMHCAGCAEGVKRSLEALPEVAAADVSYTSELAWVELVDESKGLPKVIEQIRGMGYDVVSEKVLLAIEGMHCAACTGAVERGLMKVPGVLSAQVSLPAKSAQVTVLQGVVTLKQLIAAVEKAGYEASPLVEGEAIERATKGAWLRLALVIYGLVTFAVLMALAMDMTSLEPSAAAFLSLVIATPAQLLVGWEFYRSAFKAALSRTSNMDTLVALGATAAYLYSVWAVWAGEQQLYFDGAIGVMSIVLVGRTLEAFATGRASGALKALMKLAPKQASLLTAEGEQVVAAELLEPGQRVRLRPGETVPVDSRVVEGESTVDESSLTGESIPISKVPGDEVLAGTLNQTGALVLEVMRPASESFISQMQRLVREAQSSKPPIQRLADRVAAVFVPVMLAIAAVTFLAWVGYGRLTGAEAILRVALINAVSVLVVACPCALGLATPVAVVVALGNAARMGLLLRDAGVIERTVALNAIAFDKTGTLTVGHPTLQEIVPFGAERVEALAVAAALEVNSEHPLAKAVVEQARREEVAFKPSKEFEALSGRGAKAKLEGTELLVGSLRLLGEQGVEGLEGAKAAYERLALEGMSVAGLARGGQLLALLGFRDELKPEAPEVLSALRARGLATYMLTGDSEATGIALGQAAGVDQVMARLLPEEKVQRIAELQAEGKRVAMVGDGVNDAAALAQADLGIAVATGTEVAIEAAQVTLIAKSLEPVEKLFSLAEVTLRIIKQNLFWAFGYNLVLVPAAAFGVLTPMLAATFMALSSLVVVGNALRLKGWK